MYSRILVMGKLTSGIIYQRKAYGRARFLAACMWTFVRLKDDPPEAPLAGKSSRR